LNFAKGNSTVIKKQEVARDYGGAEAPPFLSSRLAGLN
jgi:hypothetical protein